MSARKITNNNEEIDLSYLLKKWWSFRVQIISGTMIVALLSTIILVIFDKTYLNQKTDHIITIIKNDYGNNSRIVATLRSAELIKDALENISLNLNVDELLEKIIIKNSTNPLSEKLLSRINLLKDTDIKRLSLSNKELGSITKSLSNDSKELITIQLYHAQLNLSSEQAKNFIIQLINVANKNLMLRTSRDSINLDYIDIVESNDFLNETDQLFNYSNKMNSIQKNLSTMRTKYKSILNNIDLQNLSTQANINQKLLFELSNKLGNNVAIDTLNINIAKKSRDIEDLKNSLTFFNVQNIQNNEENIQDDKPDDKSTNTTQLDGEVFDKILSIGSALSLNNFKLETVVKIQNIQAEKSELIKQKELLIMPLPNMTNNINLENITKRIGSLSTKINEATNQVRSLVEPESAIKVFRNPEVVELNSKSIINIMGTVLVLSVLSFLCISFISILLPKKNSRKARTI